MDSKKISETLEIGFGESNSRQTENPCNKILEGADSVFSCNSLTEDCNAHVNAETNQMNKGILDVCPEDKLSALNDTSRAENNDLFEEVLGPSSGFDESNNDLNNTVDHEDVDEPVTFNMGDLIWAKTRSRVWWPGIVSDPSSNAASKDSTKSGKKEGSFLVKYFGNPSLAWCSRSDTKSFIEYFEQMSRQNKSRNFVASVAKALSEIGQHVKSNMTCPCIVKETKTQRSTKKLDVRVQFEPSSFLARIRGIACTGSVPGKVELVVMKNCLSPFYRSIGHCHLSLQLLKPSNDSHDNDAPLASRKKKRNHNTIDTGSSSGKGSESLRQKKKSKYLSYPYASEENLEQKSTPQANCSGENSRKRGSKKHLKEGHHVNSKEDNLDACSTELLTELHSTARDCFSLKRSKYSDSLMRFYYSFRMFAFLDREIACEHVESQKEPDSAESENLKLDSASVKEGSVNNKKTERMSLKAKGKAMPGKKATKKKERVISKTVVQMEGIEKVEESENLKLDVKEGSDSAANDKNLEGDILKGKGNATPRKKAPKKKKGAMSTGVQMEAKVEESENLKLEVKEVSDNTLNDKIPEKDSRKAKGNAMGSNINPNNSSFVINFEQTPQLPQIDMITKPDFSGTPTFSVEHAKSLQEKRNEGMLFPNMNGTDQTLSWKDVQVTVENFPQLNNGVGIIDTGTNKFPSAVSIFGGSESNTINFGLATPVQSSIGLGLLFPCSGKPERKKRKRKEKISQVASVIPDLNGNAVNASSSSGNSISPEGSSVKINGVQDLGGGLLLKFAPEFPLPSKQTLISTFSRFGLVKESEIQVLDDSTTQIMYERSSDATFAFRSLEKSNPFGASLASFNLHAMPAGNPVVKVKKRKFKPSVPVNGSAAHRKLKMQKPPVIPVDASKTAAKPCDAPPDIAYIRQNVEMMKSALEKAGDSLSPEMRAKLENEIKGFLNKIGSMGGSSSS